MCKVLLAAGANVTLVDMSSEACKLAKEIAPRVVTMVGDAITYLEGSPPRYDLYIAMGLLEYLPPTALDVLFRCCYNELILYVGVVEGHLEYATRVTVYSRKDIAQMARNYGWVQVAEHIHNEVIFAKYRRIDA
jgi:hypothetical protein